MSDLDPWMEQFAGHAAFRFRLSEAVKDRELVTVATLIGAMDEFEGVEALCNPETDDEYVMQKMVAVEDTMTRKLVDALESQDRENGGVVCGVYGVPCLPKSHASIAVTAMSFLLAEVCAEWRPSMVQTYRTLVKLGLETIQTIRREG